MGSISGYSTVALELSLAGYTRAEQMDFISRLRDMEKILPRNAQLPLVTFKDLQKKIGAIAKEKDVTLEVVRRRVLQNPALLMPQETQKKLSPEQADAMRDFARDQKYSPLQNMIAKAAIAYRKEHGVLPTTGFDHLPPGSKGWVVLRNKIKGKCFSEFIAEYEGRKIRKPQGGRKPKYMPSDAEIVGAALRIRGKYNCLPDDSYKNEELPEESCGWSNISRNLKKRKLTIGKLVALHEQTEYKNKGSTKPFPDDATIIEKALIIRERQGTLPKDQNGHDELPEGSAGWRSIRIGLQKRGTTVGTLVKRYEDSMSRGEIPRSPETMPDIHSAFLRCANYLKENPGARIHDIKRDLTPLDEKIHERTLAGLDSLKFSQPVRCVIDFMHVSGLLEKKGGEMVPASQSAIDILLYQPII